MAIGLGGIAEMWAERNGSARGGGFPVLGIAAGQRLHSKGSSRRPALSLAGALACIFAAEFRVLGYPSLRRKGGSSRDDAFE